MTQIADLSQTILWILIISYRITRRLPLLSSMCIALVHDDVEAFWAFHELCVVILCSFIEVIDIGIICFESFLASFHINWVLMLQIAPGRTSLASICEENCAPGKSEFVFLISKRVSWLWVFLHTKNSSDDDLIPFVESRLFTLYDSTLKRRSFRETLRALSQWIYSFVSKKRKKMWRQ